MENRRAFEFLVVITARAKEYDSIPFTTRYLLDAENDGTRLIVSETGFEALPDEVRQTRFEQITEEYRTVMANLKAYLERQIRSESTSLTRRRPNNGND